MKRNKLAKLQRGFSLLETLIAIVVVALGILGIIGIQMRTLIDTQTTVRRGQAIRYIEDFSERLRINPNALINIDSYLSNYTTTATSYDGADCITKTCTSKEQASFDLLQWKSVIATNLPSGQASIFLAPGETDATNRRQLGVIIAWRENQRDDLKSDALDATQFRNFNKEDPTNYGKLTEGTNEDNACPDGFICHLQYITVAARCAPYGGSNTPHCA